MCVVWANTQFAMVRFLSLLVFFFFFCFFGLHTGHTVRQVWTSEGSKCIVLWMDVPFVV